MYVLGEPIKWVHRVIQTADNGEYMYIISKKNSCEKYL